MCQYARTPVGWMCRQIGSSHFICGVFFLAGAAL